MRIFLTITLLLTSIGLLAAQTVNPYSISVNQAIPDGNPVGLTSSTNLTGFAAGTLITDVNVTLNITGGYNGDLYAYLVGPGGGYSVLLNRTGVSSSDSFGYGDSGFNITLDDSAANNIHYYQTVSNPNGGVLTGTWRPDGENVDPNGSSVGSAPATTPLSSFNNANPNGTWQLFVADLSSDGGQSTLVSWGMSVTVVPEPQPWAMCVIGALIFVGLRGRKNSDK